MCDLVRLSKMIGDSGCAIWNRLSQSAASAESTPLKRHADQAKRPSTRMPNSANNRWRPTGRPSMSPRRSGNAMIRFVGGRPVKVPVKTTSGDNTAFNLIKCSLDITRLRP